MIDRDSMRGYLSSAAFQEAAAAAAGDGVPRPFVTISRQAGAGGSELARLLVREMDGRKEELFQGWRVFDRELCEMVAEDPKLSVFFDSLTQELFRGEFADFIARFITDASPQIKVIHRMFKVVRAAAGTGKAVIVGRGAGCLTRRLALGVHVRLVAPRAFRLARLRERLGVDLKEAERFLEEQDASRALLVKKHFYRDIDDPLLYDAVWNTESVPLPTVAAAVIKIVEDRCAQKKALPEAAGRGR